MLVFLLGLFCGYEWQLERERADLRTQVAVLKESQAALNEELKACSAALLQNEEEMVQQRAESSALRYIKLIHSLYFYMLLCHR